jgi:hypothetical protein
VRENPDSGDRKNKKIIQINNLHIPWLGWAVLGGITIAYKKLANPCDAVHA